MSGLHDFTHIEMLDDDGALLNKCLATDLVKSHVKGYTRKDGVFVKDHDDSRTKKAANPKQGDASNSAMPDHVVKQVQDCLAAMQKFNASPELVQATIEALLAAYRK